LRIISGESEPGLVGLSREQSNFWTDLRRRRRRRRRNKRSEERTSSRPFQVSV
jgi:hypothetical protein